MMNDAFQSLPPFEYSEKLLLSSIFSPRVYSSKFRHSATANNIRHNCIKRTVDIVRGKSLFWYVTKWKPKTNILWYCNRVLIWLCLGTAICDSQRSLLLVYIDVYFEKLLLWVIFKHVEARELHCFWRWFLTGRKFVTTASDYNRWLRISIEGR